MNTQGAFAQLGGGRSGRRRAVWAAALAAAVLAGCAGTPIATERQARAELETVARAYRPGDARPELPALRPDSPLADYLRYGMLNSPRVEAAYYAWAAGVERITPARSLPDPRITFESDITDMIQTVMPGLMIDLPGPGKLRAAGDAAAAESAVGYWAFAGEALRTAYDVKSAYVRLHFVEDTLRVQREALALLGDVESVAQRQVGAGRATIQDVLRSRIAQDQLANQIANLEDSRRVLEAEFRAAMGVAPSDGSVPIPARFEPGQPPPDADEVLRMAAASNPALRRMEADVRRAQAMLDLARTSRVPDFSVGLEADVKANPIMWRPTASMTLPVWRDKIAAEIAAAQNDQRSAQARLSAEQVSLAAELASMLYMLRESGRNESLYARTLLPKARQSLEAARSGYGAGRSSFLDVLDAQGQLLDFELARIEAQTQHELAIASVSLLIAGAAPESAPLLPHTDGAAPGAGPTETHP